MRRWYRESKMIAGLTRREFGLLTAAGAATVLSPAALAQTATPLITRPIPGSGEPLPAVGLGTAEVFDFADDTTRQKAAAVVKALVGNGGTLIDTASTYG